MEIKFPFDTKYEKGGKFLNIVISPDSQWQYKAHDIAVHAAKKAFESIYNSMIENPDALIEYVKLMDFIELDNEPIRQSVQVGDKIVLMNDLLKKAELKVVEK